ncbi:MAG: precorrin-2 dehydrogenase/sirohydrochlorin ferrochelatase family protein [Fusobacteriaceae bacterium]
MEKTREKKFFPVMVDIEGKSCLVVGAGKIARRKIETLKEYGAYVTVVAPEILVEIENMKNVTCIKKCFSEKDLEGKFLVIAATDRVDINSDIAKICSQRGILVNNITSKSEMNLSFMSILEGSEYKIGISGKGNPKRALKIKEIIKKALE